MTSTATCNLSALLQQDSHKLVYKGRNSKGGEWATSCPYCKDGKDRFIVWPYAERPGFWCRVCGKTGDILDYLMDIRGMSFTEAKSFLGEGYSPPVIHREETFEPPHAVDMAVPSLAQWIRRTRGQAMRQEAIRYFGQYGLPAEAVDKYQLGACSLGWTIPHFVMLNDGTVQPKGIKVRLKAPRDNKYITYKPDPDRTYCMSGVFLDHWITSPDSQRQGPYLPYIFVVEDEKSAMVLDWLGYPAIAYTPKRDWNLSLDVIFSHTSQVFIIADNDTAKNNGNVGMTKALKFQSYLKRTRNEILMHPIHNDIADLSKAEGPLGVHEWLLQQLL